MTRSIIGYDKPTTYGNYHLSRGCKRNAFQVKIQTSLAKSIPQLRSFSEDHEQKNPED